MAKDLRSPQFQKYIDEDCRRCRNKHSFYCTRCSIGEHFREDIQELDLGSVNYDTKFGWNDDE